MSTKLALFDIFCGLLALLGLAVIIYLHNNASPQSLWLLVGISGFAAITRFFIAEESTSSFLNTVRMIGGLGGLGIVSLSFFRIH